MRFPLLQNISLLCKAHGVSMESFYRRSGISRQGYYQGLARHTRDQEVIKEIETLVRGYRLEKDRRAGSRSLYHNLSIKARFKMGITKFERLMSLHGLTLAPMRVKVVTTQSVCQSWNYANLITGRTIGTINEVVVGDITYLTIGKDRYYLFCLTDVYSARIVGCNLSKHMRAEDAKVALEQWVSLRGADKLNGCIHHTDGGSQYFSKLYLSATKARGLKISVARNCLENGYAEQRNGFIKYHLIPTIKYTSEHRLKQEIERIIYGYNNERKQQALGWLSPVMFEKKWQAVEDAPRVALFDFYASTK